MTRVETMARAMFEHDCASIPAWMDEWELERAYYTTFALAALKAIRVPEFDEALDAAGWAMTEAMRAAHQPINVNFKLMLRKVLTAYFDAAIAEAGK